MIPQTVTEYQIPGTPRPGRCHFTYRSTGRLEGRFNSPRHPQNYPNDLNCTYVFLATPSQQVGSQQKVHVLYLLSHISLSLLSFPISYCGVLCFFLSILLFRNSWVYEKNSGLFMTFTLCIYMICLMKTRKILDLLTGILKNKYRTLAACRPF